MHRNINILNNRLTIENIKMSDIFDIFENIMKFTNPASRYKTLIRQNNIFLTSFATVLSIDYNYVKHNIVEISIMQGLCVCVCVCIYTHT